MMLGMMNDAWPSKEDVAFFAEVAAGLPWVVAAHGVYGKANFGYQAHRLLQTPQGHEEPDGLEAARPLCLSTTATTELGNVEPAVWRTMPEFAITGDQRGIGHLGADFWKVFKDKKGQRRCAIYGRYPQSNWRNLDIYTALLAPARKARPSPPATSTSGGNAGVRGPHRHRTGPRR